MYSDLFKLKLLETRSMYMVNARSIHVNKYSIVIFQIDAILELKVWFTLLLEFSRGILIIRKWLLLCIPWEGLCLQCVSRLPQIVKGYVNYLTTV